MEVSSLVDQVDQVLRICKFAQLVELLPKVISNLSGSTTVEVLVCVNFLYYQIKYLNLVGENLIF